jgi:tricorn protease
MTYRGAFIRFALFLGLAVPVHGAAAQDDEPLLLRDPGLSATQICFEFAGDIWLVPRSGGDARRLTATADAARCRFSPDGRMVAYTATRDNNDDVYVVAVDGGTPTRLTWHPSPDVTVGWTPDGEVLFGSLRDNETSNGLPFRLYAQGVGEVTATVVDLPRNGLAASFSSEGARLAYMPILPANAQWKLYRGGRTTPIWIADLDDAEIEKLPRNNSNDIAPMWVGDTVFFLSDRDGRTTLFAYDLESKQVTRRIDNGALDIKAAQVGPGAIVYEQFGEVRLYDLNGGGDIRVPIRLDGELTAALPQWVNVGGRLTSGALSPTGVRAVFEGRGDIITVPAKKGDPRNLTKTTGVMERSPAWSPDGQTVAYFTEASGQYQLELRAQNGMGDARRIDLGGGDNFYYDPAWSPNGEHIGYSNSRGEIWTLEVESETRTLVDTNPWGRGSFPLSWSKDSRWITYSRQIDNTMSAVFVWDRATGTAHQVTDGLSDATSPVFDASGKYLWFVASTDAGPSNDFSMTTFDHPVTRNLYAIVLRRDLPSPLVPESDEEAPKSDSTEAEATVDSAVTIDFEAIDQRTIPMPVDAKNYAAVAAGAAGIVILAEVPIVPVSQSANTPSLATLHKFDLAEREATELVSGISSFDVSRDGAKLLYSKGRDWAIAALGEPVKAGDGSLATGNIQVETDPLAEWAQMYREGFRMQRAFFYDPNFHGLDLDATERFYTKFLPGLGSRDDLNYLFAESMGNLTVGHHRTGGPSSPPDPAPRGGLLGADYRISNGQWQFARVYAGENWNPATRAPLTQPGVNVQAGEYLLAIDGVPLTADRNVHAALAGTADKQVVLRVGPSADGDGARDVTVVPTASEVPLRHLAWIDSNRRTVDSLSGGKLAYLYIPNTANQGYNNFNRYFFSQRDKAGAVVDERYNGGGNIADYMVYYLQKMRPFNYVTQKYGEDLPLPAGIYGPKVMLINEYAGSGGDELPWLFRRYNVGTIVGTRTWGGLVGVGGYPALMDGGTITAPHIALWSLEGEYEVENQGVAPDIEVDVDPAAWRQGRDVQLERAVAILMAQLAEEGEFTTPARPAYPTWAKGNGPGRRP